MPNGDRQHTLTWDTFSCPKSTENDSVERKCNYRKRRQRGTNNEKNNTEIPFAEHFIDEIGEAFAWQKKMTVLRPLICESAACELFI